MKAGDGYRAAEALATAAANLRACADWQLPAGELVDVSARVARLRAAVDAAYLALVAEVEARGVASVSTPAGERVATTTAGFLRTSALMSAAEAARDVAAARAVAGEGPLVALGEQLAAGALTRAHVDVAVRCLDQLPSGLRRTAEQRRALSDFFVRLAPLGPVRDLGRAAAALRLQLDPGSAELFDPDADQRRYLDIATDVTGMVVGRFQLDAVAGAALQAAIQTFGAPRPTGSRMDAGSAAAAAADVGAAVAGGVDTGLTPEPDGRTARQRRADALWTLADLALGTAPGSRGERPRVVVTVTPDDLLRACPDLDEPGHRRAHEPPRTDLGGRPDHAAVRRFACDAVVHLLVAAPGTHRVLDVGRDQRFATPAQRRALAERDRGCLVPGCGAPPEGCDAHHVVHWADGGPTDLANLVLLCPAHHSAAHAGRWQVRTGTDGIPLVVPPAWVDPARRPRRGSHHERDHALAEALAGRSP